MKRGFGSYFLAAVVLLFLVAIVAPVNASAYRGSGSYDYLYYIEGTGAYLLPDQDGDIFFHLGRWYRRSDNTWSIGTTSDGPWRGIFIENVPEILADLPPDFHTTHQLGRIPYRYVTGSGSGRYDYSSCYDCSWYGYRYNYYGYGPCCGWGKYRCDYDPRAYRRHWRRLGRFLFFAAPHIIDD
jgi:hypothetical protein